MPGEHEVRAGGADAGIEVLHVSGARFGEGDAMYREASLGQRLFEKRQRPTFRRRHRCTAEKIAGDRNRISGHIWTAQSLSNSLMLVFARVFSSTRLTITA